jgi:gliding motility-associated-like protein
MKKHILLLAPLFFCLAGIAQIPTAGLVAFYPFNGNANDESGNGNNGILYGPALTTDRCENPNSAYSFDGMNDYIDLPPESFLLNEYSYSVWIKVPAFPSPGDDGWMIFSPGALNSGLCQGFSIHSSGGICGTSYCIGDNPHGAWAVSPPIEKSKWFHLVYVRSYSILKIYINGVLQTYEETNVYLPYPNNQPANYGSSPYSALIGCRSNFKSDDYFLGKIDDLAIYNRAITQEEVLKLYYSDCHYFFVNGLKEICPGTKNVKYSIDLPTGYIGFNWQYSGENVALHEASNTVFVDFLQNATSGTLSLIATGPGKDTIHSSIDIAVKLVDNAQEIPTDGLVAYYPFAGNAHDESGNGNNGLVFGPVLGTDRCGIANNAYHFNGFDDYINLQKDFDYPRRTVNLWFNADVIDGIERHIYISDHPQLQNGFTQIKIMEQNGIKEIRSSAGFGGGPAEAHAEVRENEWHMITVVADENSVKHYLDATLIGTFSNGIVTSLRGEPSALLGTSRVFDRFFRGMIDDVRIYERALNPDEVLSLYLSNCEFIKLSGLTKLCSGPDSIKYSVDTVPGYTDYEWQFDGQNAELKPDKNIAYLHVSPSFSDGSVKVFARGPCMTTRRASLTVHMDLMPGVPGNIYGPQAVCPGQKDALFYVNSVPGADSYIWKFSNGDVITADTGSQSYLDFGTDFNEGYLTVSAKNSCGTSYPSSALHIVKTENAPSPPGNISGPGEVCLSGQNIPFSVGPSAGAVSYSWKYSGTGAKVTGTGESVTISFNGSASDGILTVSATSSCGTSLPSPGFDIHIKKLPSAGNPISGPQEICQNTGNVPFTTTAIEGAISYEWNFSGSNVTIQDDALNAKLFFFENATSGNLTVAGINECGPGMVSDKYPIIVKNCTEPHESLHIPNSFTPNGDGTNDLFIIDGLPENCNIMVFDRSGKKIFSSDNYQNNWNGTDQDGNVLETGTYWYVLVIPNLPNEFKGFIYLKR